MFVLIWATLLFSIREIDADSGASVEEKTVCHYGFCITLIDAEITAEAGLCAVIPCSFSTGSGFTTRNMVWFKCEASKQRCDESEIIFHSNKYDKVQSGFRGRVSLLEPDVYQKNCSIIINDLTESDSGSYQIRVNGYDQYYRPDGFTFPLRASVSVKGLIQKPTVKIPPLTEGQQTTLTCTAPGLCSGSDPEITWMWRGAGEKDSHITGNITAFETEILTAVTQRHSSTLTFNASAEHHGTSITCEISFSNGITTEETVTLNVTYMKEVKISGTTSVKEGETLNLTCSVESFPPSRITWTKFSERNMQNGTETNLQNDTETYVWEESGMGSFFISNVTAADSGQYICTAKHLNNTWMEEVNFAVIYMKEPVITGNTTVPLGDALNLTCSVESFPPSRITWTIPGSNTNPPKLNTDLQSDTGSATLVIHNMTPEHSGQYICTVQHLDTNETIFANVTATLFPNILNTRCEVQSEVLTCVCISEAVPLPTIKWPLLKNHSEYSVIATVSKHTVNSTMTLTVKDHSSAAVECVSSNEVGEVKQNINIITSERREDQGMEMLNSVPWLEVIIAFLIGIVLSAVICCLVTKCHRKKQKSFGTLDATLEMVTSQEDPLIDAGQAGEDDQTYYQEAAEEEEEGGGGGGAVVAEKPALDLDGGPKDVEYANIDFSALKRKRPREAAKKQETTETEYAEIKKQVKEGREDNGGEEVEVLEAKEEVEEEQEKEEEEEVEEEEMMEEDKEIKQCVPEEEEDEDVAVYSNVKEIIGEI